MDFSRKDRSSALSLAASYEMKRQNDLWSVLTCASEQYTLPSVQIAIYTAIRGLTMLTALEFTWPRILHLRLVKFMSLSQV